MTSGIVLWGVAVMLFLWQTALTFLVMRSKEEGELETHRLGTAAFALSQVVERFDAATWERLEQIQATTPTEAPAPASAPAEHAPGYPAPAEAPVVHPGPAPQQPFTGYAPAPHPGGFEYPSAPQAAPGQAAAPVQPAPPTPLYPAPEVPNHQAAGLLRAVPDPQPCPYYEAATQAGWAPAATPAPPPLASVPRQSAPAPAPAPRAEAAPRAQAPVAPRKVANGAPAASWGRPVAVPGDSRRGGGPYPRRCH